MKTRNLVSMMTALTLTGAGLTSAAHAETSRTLKPAELQQYAADVLTFAEAARLDERTAGRSLSLHGVQHTVQRAWSDARFRVYRQLTPPTDEQPALASYVLAVSAAHGTAASDWGSTLRDLQAAAFPVEAFNPLVEDGELKSVGLVGWGFNRMVHDYLVGTERTDRWSGIGSGEAADGLLLDIEDRLAMGEQVELVVTGHGIGGAAAELLSLYLTDYFDETYPGAALQIRFVGFNAPPAMGADAAGRFAERAQAVEQDGIRRLQALRFTRAGDIVTTFGMTGEPALRVAAWIPFTLEPDLMNPDVERDGPCMHVELPRISRTMLAANHGIDGVKADLSDLELWSDAAACMSGTDERPGFQSFWGPSGPVGHGETIALLAPTGDYVSVERGGRLEARHDRIDEDALFTVHDAAGEAAAGVARFGEVITLLATDGFMGVDDRGAVEADHETIDDEIALRLVRPDAPESTDPVRCGDTVAVLTSGGHYLSLGGRGDDKVEAKAETLDEAAQLVVDCTAR